MSADKKEPGVVQIAHRKTGAVLFECETDSVREAVVAAVAAGANLSGADLSGAKGGRLVWVPDAVAVES